MTSDGSTFRGNRQKEKLEQGNLLDYIHTGYWHCGFCHWNGQELKNHGEYNQTCPRCERQAKLKYHPPLNEK